MSKKLVEKIRPKNLSKKFVYIGIHTVGISSIRTLGIRTLGIHTYPRNRYRRCKYPRYMYRRYTYRRYTYRRYRKVASSRPVYYSKVTGLRPKVTAHKDQISPS